jgi:ribosomal protein S18 acetylase RimI-like enzyme
VSLAVRDSRPDDAPFLAWAMQEAARGHLERGVWDVALPGPEAERLELLARLARAEARSFCHHGGFLVGEAEGRPVATLCGYQPGAANQRLFLDALRQACGGAGWSRARIREMLGRFAPFTACGVEPPEDTWVVEWVATLPSQRGRGHARRLLDAVFERGRSLGLETTHLSVLIGNAGAQALYERVGFRVVQEMHHPDFEAVMKTPGLRVLERPLGSAAAGG